MLETKAAIASRDVAELLELRFSDIIEIDWITVITIAIMRRVKKGSLSRKISPFRFLSLFQDMRERYIWLNIELQNFLKIFQQHCSIK